VTSGKQTIVYDAQTRGFAVLISGKTDRKSYVVCYGARFQRRTIGDVSLFTLEEARDKAIDWVRLMKKGIDPNDIDKPARTQSSAITLRQLLDRRLKDDKRPLRPASVKCYENIIHNHLSDWLDRPIAEITATGFMIYTRSSSRRHARETDDRMARPSPISRYGYLGRC
jgi:hypothetical protein